MKEKNKDEYFRKKKLKQEAKKRESEHKVDYTISPVRDEPINRHSYNPDDGFMSTIMMLQMMKMRMRQKRTEDFFSPPKKKGPSC